MISNGGFTHLQSGDTFNLFDWTIVGGVFNSVTLPVLLPGLTWNTNNLLADGTIRVEGTVVPPQFNPPLLSGGLLTVNGSGGAEGITYYVLATSDLGLPISSWTPLATNVFDASGNFSFSDPVDSAPMRFYLLSLP